MAELKELLTYLLGIGQEDLDILQMTVRALIVYPLGIALVHVGDKRFLGGIAAFDFLLAIIIGSILSREQPNKPSLTLDVVVRRRTAPHRKAAL
jgi:hypothetical protein